MPHADEKNEKDDKDDKHFAYLLDVMREDFILDSIVTQGFF